MDCENQIYMVSFYWDIRKQLEKLSSIIILHMTRKTHGTCEIKDVNLKLFGLYWKELTDFSINLNTHCIEDDSYYLMLKTIFELHNTIKNNNIIEEETKKMYLDTFADQNSKAAKAVNLYKNAMIFASTTTTGSSVINLGLAFSNFIDGIKNAYQKFKSLYSLNEFYDIYFDQLVNKFYNLYYRIPSNDMKNQLYNIVNEIAYMPPCVHPSLPFGGEYYKSALKSYTGVTENLS